jgi:hypothetical protein
MNKFELECKARTMSLCMQSAGLANDEIGKLTVGLRVFEAAKSPMFVRGTGYNRAHEHI